MSWPEDWPTVVVRADFGPFAPDGIVPQGTVLFEPRPSRVPSGDLGVILVGSVNATVNATGGIVQELAADVVYRVTESLTVGPPRPAYNISLPASGGDVDLVAFVWSDPPPPDFVVITGPRGSGGGGGDDGGLVAAENLADLPNKPLARGNLGLGSAATAASSAFDAAGLAAAAQSAAAADATNKVNAEATRADGAYLAKGNNLSDLPDKAAARSSLQLGTAAQAASGSFDAAGLAAAAQSAAAADATAKVAAEVTRANAAYDAAGAAGTASAAALVAAKAYADTGDGTTLQAAKDYTDGHAGGGGAAAPPLMRSKRFVSDNNSGLPAAASWTVVVTSGTGTLPAEPIQVSIPAVAGNRIRVVGGGMYTGSHFLDWVMLDSAGAINQYAVQLGSDHLTTPGTEGNPGFYPGLSFSKIPSEPIFTVGAEHISGGQVTIGLAHQGTGTGGDNKVFAYEDLGTHITYAFALRLENIDQTEPAP